jgi:5-hydroxyisourate hydrolase
MKGITTHVLDTSRGQPAAGVPIRLSVRTGQDQDVWKDLGETTTNSDGRAPDLLSADAKISAGVYRLIFETQTYFSSISVSGFYPSVSLIFEITNPEQHHHVPLLLSPYGYSTYRGS